MLTNLFQSSGSLILPNYAFEYLQRRRQQVLSLGRLKSVGFFPVTQLAFTHESWLLKFLTLVDKAHQKDESH